MPLYLVNGSPGAGKSTACAELNRRGFIAYDTDLDQLSAWSDGVLRLPPSTVRRIAAEVGDGAGFICGSTGNEGEVWDLFTAVAFLTVGADTLRRRLIQRGGFGSAGAELEGVLGRHTGAESANARFGAHLVDADRPVEEVVDDLLTALGVARN
ncbi:hypothetical protein [Kribbella sp. NPDC051620]|uniref:hypothetical protein n=1 Tax=Kribbella sp. NPDC051620 TaxID=3364120 RepID=UPI003791E2A3